MTNPRILRSTVTADGQWHKIETGQIVQVGHRPGDHVGDVSIWFIDDTTTSPRNVKIYGTGHDLDPDTGRYLGTAIVDTITGPLVWHVFEQTTTGDQ